MHRWHRTLLVIAEKPRKIGERKKKIDKEREREREREREKERRRRRRRRRGQSVEERGREGKKERDAI